MDLAKTQKLQDLPSLWVHVVDTADADHEGHLGLRLHIEAALCLGLPLQSDQVLLLLQDECNLLAPDHKQSQSIIEQGVGPSLSSDTCLSQLLR